MKTHRKESNNPFERSKGFASRSLIRGNRCTGGKNYYAKEAPVFVALVASSFRSIIWWSCDWAGGVGSYALRALTKLSGRAGKVPGIERFHRSNQKGSSRGGSRVIVVLVLKTKGYIPCVNHSIRDLRHWKKKLDHRWLTNAVIWLFKTNHKKVKVVLLKINFASGHWGSEKKGRWGLVLGSRCFE